MITVLQEQNGWYVWMHSVTDKPKHGYCLAFGATDDSAISNAHDTLWTALRDLPTSKSAKYDPGRSK